MGISVLKPLVLSVILAGLCIGLCGMKCEAAETVGIDDDTVISVEQAGSIASSAGDYGWDSRGAVVGYSSMRGEISGNLGKIMFADEDGIQRAFLWDEWGGAFPDRWGRMLAEKLRSITPEKKIPELRAALSDSLVFDCTWIIAIGTKSSKAGGKLYKTLRTDDTLRVAYGKNLAKESVQEKLFTGNDMAGSLQYILPHENWGSSSLATFAERNPYSYIVQINSYDINLRATNCVECASKGLPTGSISCHHVKAGGYFNERLPIVYDGKAYSGDMSFAWEGQTVSYEERNYPGYKRNSSGDDLSGLVGVIDGTKILVSGDSTLFLCYEALTEENPGTDTDANDDGPVDPVIPEVKDQTVGNSYSVTDPLAMAAIRSDVFDTSYAIPSTEPVYIYAAARNYLYSLDASVVRGAWTMQVNVVFPYELNWEEDGQQMNETGSVTQTVYVTRPYSYVHLNSFVYYTLDSITIGNKAVSPYRTVLTPSDLGVTMPSCGQPKSYGSSSVSIGANIMLPEGFSDYIIAGEIIVNSDNGKPDVPVVQIETARALAEAATNSMRCRNDELVFAGSSVLGTQGWHSYNGAESVFTNAFNPSRLVFDTRTLYGQNYLSIPAATRNTVFVTDARVIRYTPVIRFGGADIYYNPLLTVNNVSVHTPVICELEIEESRTAGTYNSNSLYNQEVSAPENGVLQLIIGTSDSYGIQGHENDSCDFMLSVSNSGQHSKYSSKLGNTYDYYYNVSGINGAGYVASNEVRFPFDVYLDVGNDRQTVGDRIIQAGEWFNIGIGKYRFYIPEYVPEGDYVIEARSRAINSYSREDMIGAGYKHGRLYLHDNVSPYDYVAADSVKVHVSGKLSGLRLTGISSDAEWGNINLMDRGAVGARISGRNDGTLVSGLAEGRAKPDKLENYYFYYTVGRNNELGLATGRHERFSLPLLAGSHPDTTRQNIGMLKAGYTWTFAINTTGTIMASDKASVKIKPVFEWISSDMKTRESAQLFYREGFLDKGREEIHVNSSARTFTGGTGSRYRQTWEFNYSLPESPVVKTQDTIRKDGYLVVRFEITACDANGRDYLNYSATCNMWKTEGQQLNRTDYYGRQFDFKYGDVIIVDLEKTKKSDYVTDHKY